MSGEPKVQALDLSERGEALHALAGGRRADAQAAALAEGVATNRGALWVLTETLEDADLAKRGRRALVAEAKRAGDLPMTMLALASLQPDAAFWTSALTPFATGSARYKTAPKPPALQANSAAETAVLAAISAVETRAAEGDDEAATRVSLLSDLGIAALVAFAKRLTVRVVKAGETIVATGDAGDAAYLTVRGTLAVRREPEGPIVAHLGSGALFGELALLSRAPRTATVTSVSPAILLVANRADLAAAVAECKALGEALAAHCRERLLSQALHSAPVFTSVDDDERPLLAKNFELRVHDEGELLVHEGDAAKGLFVVAAGRVQVARDDDGERLFLDELGPGDVFGELATVLRRTATADVVAVRPTVTLFLPREKFVDLVRERPLVLHALYLLAVDRDDETRAATASTAFALDGDDLFV